MSKLIQIRGVPDSTHRRLKAKAARSGKTLSDLLLEEVVRFAELPSHDELLAELHAATPVDLGMSSVEAVRAARHTR